jgi:hypothetical protein
VVEHRPGPSAAASTRCARPEFSNHRRRHAAGAFDASSSDAIATKSRSNVPHLLVLTLASLSPSPPPSMCLSPCTAIADKP